MPEQEIGIVTHYFKGPSVAIVRLAADVKIGDTLRFVGHTSDFTEQVTSMQVDHKPVEAAQAGQDVAVQVVSRARPHDKVFRVT
jgi:putative protease